MSVHGITNQNMLTVKKSLSTTGHAPIDRRGSHSNRPMKKTIEAVENVMKHISSLQDRPSHYSLHKTSKMYLPEELNIKLLHQM